MRATATAPILVRDDRRHQTVTLVTLNIRAIRALPNSPGFSDEPGLFWCSGRPFREIFRIRHGAVKGLALANRVRRTVTLDVEVINDRDIVVSHSRFDFSVTYRKDGDAPMIAIDGIVAPPAQPTSSFGRRPGKPPIRKPAPSVGSTPKHPPRYRSPRGSDFFVPT